ncbi:hypothetical protein EI555_006528 [Monodon monoceros]|uniref:Uncharacterized protein n=1 Tax=Monodon monoceros TaxID=40151 RepID=A0A4U1EHS9_MONMO|nr:hypothetical protein EI555_006528 [Monodon monoceros]
MTTMPSGEARASSIPTHGDSRCTDIPTVRSQSQVPLLADVPTAHDTAASAEQQDVGQASKPATLGATSASGDKDKHEAAAGHAQEPTALLAPLAPGALQRSRGFQNLVQKVLVQESSTTQNPQIFQLYSLIKEETPQAAGVPDREQELAPSTPSAVVQSPQNAEAQPIMSTADANDQLDTRAADTAEAVEENPEGQEALNPGTDALPSAPASPGPRVAAVERRALDSTASENNYMRSMTSLLGGGEGSISSLADILVWSDTAMGMATGTLASGHGSVTDVLHNTGAQPALHLQHPGECQLCLILRAGSGDQSALHSVTHMLEPVERRTVEGILSAMHYLTSHLAPRQAHAGPNLDEAPRSAASRDPGSTHALLSHASLPWTALPRPGNKSLASAGSKSARCAGATLQTNILYPSRALRRRVREQPRPGRPAKVAGLLGALRPSLPPPPPPPPRRPDGFFHDCIRPRAVFVPAIPSRACELVRLSPARRGFSRAQLEHCGAASPSPASGAPAEMRPPRDPEIPCREPSSLQTHRSVRPVPVSKARSP